MAQSKTLVTLRIDAQTFILVPPEKANETYRQAYIDRLRKNKSMCGLGYTISHLTPKRGFYSKKHN